MMDNDMDVILQDLSSAIGDLKTLISESSVAKHENSSASTITVSAGGVGLWIAVTCTIACFIMSSGAAVLSIYGFYRGDRMSDYLQAIYAQAPQLKPKESSNEHDHYYHASEEAQQHNGTSSGCNGRELHDSGTDQGGASGCH